MANFRAVSICLAFGAVLVLVVGTGSAIAVQYTVPANPLWMDTGIDLKPSASVTSASVKIHDATGTWEYGTGNVVGPDGVPPNGSEANLWVNPGNIGQLIGYTGPASPNLNNFPRAIAQNAPGLFNIGSGSVTRTATAGHLWLGMSDDYSSNTVSDNSGSLTVQVDTQYTVSVPANPLWTDTGIILTGSNGVRIHGATGTWEYGTGNVVGPDGVPPNGSEANLWVNPGNIGQLIGYIGKTPNLNAWPFIPQNDSGLFNIGSGSVTRTGVAGDHLWLGMSDDHLSNTVSDNSGSLTVQVDVVPEPSTFVLLGMGAIALLAFAWRRGRAA